VASLCSTVTVLDRGEVLASGSPGTVFNHAEVVRAYMGGRALGAASPA